MKPDFTVKAKIKKSPAEVFSAVTNSANLNQYFTHQAKGQMQEGKTVLWNWTDHPKDVEVHVHNLVQNEKIHFSWLSASGKTNHVEMNIKPIDETTTLFSIKETGWDESQEDQRASYEHCSGWENMACCMKGYLQYGIDLRK